MAIAIIFVVSLILLVMAMAGAGRGVELVRNMGAALLVLAVLIGVMTYLAIRVIHP